MLYEFLFSHNGESPAVNVYDFIGFLPIYIKERDGKVWLIFS